MLTSLRDAVKGFIDMSEFATGEKEVSDRNRYRSTDTLIEMADDLIIRPLIILSEDLRHNPDVNNIINLNMDTFSNLYLKAFDVATNIMGTKAERSLKLLSSRQVLPKDMGSFGIESLDSLTDKEQPFLPLDVEAMYDDKNKQPIFIRELELTYKYTEDKKDKSSIINVMVIADVIYVPSTELKLHLTTNGRDKLFLNRVEDLRAKLLSFWGDFIFANDMIREYKKSRLKSKTELSKFISERATNSSLKRARGTGGLDEYYSMLIISKEVTNELELSIGGSLDKNKMRKHVFESFKAMSLTRVDTDHEMLIFDLKSKSNISSASMTFKAIKKSSGNEELLDIMKYQAGMI